MSVKCATVTDLDGSNWCLDEELLSHMRRPPRQVLAAAAGVPQWLIIYILLGSAHAETPLLHPHLMGDTSCLDKQSDYVGLLMKLSVTNDIYT